MDHNERRIMRQNLVDYHRKKRLDASHFDMLMDYQKWAYDYQLLIGAKVLKPVNVTIS